VTVRTPGTRGTSALDVRYVGKVSVAKGGHVFFFSSRRRHTRWPRDWSSDVCSSALGEDAREVDTPVLLKVLVFNGRDRVVEDFRSEERRVGKEGRSRRPAKQQKKKARERT